MMTTCILTWNTNSTKDSFEVTNGSVEDVVTDFVPGPRVLFKIYLKSDLRGKNKEPE